jgi:hypothetical protein
VSDGCFEDSVSDGCVSDGQPRPPAASSISRCSLNAHARQVSRDLPHPLLTSPVPVFLPPPPLSPHSRLSPQTQCGDGENGPMNQPESL